MNLWQQARQHLIQFMMYFIAGTAESKLAFFIFSSMYSKMALISITTAIIKDPNKMEPTL
jgi:hypothetical protein